MPSGLKEPLIEFYQGMVAENISGIMIQEVFNALNLLLDIITADVDSPFLFASWLALFKNIAF